MRKANLHSAISRALIEQFESRLLMDTVLPVFGTAGDDFCTIEMDDNFIYASMNGVMVPQPIGLFIGVEVHLGGGNDTLEVRNTRGTVSVSAFLGTGADQVEIAPVSGDLDSIQAHVRIPAGSDTLQDGVSIFDDEDTGSDTYDISEPFVSDCQLHKGGDLKVNWGDDHISAGVFLNNDNNTVNINANFDMNGPSQRLTITGREPNGGSGGNDVVNFDGSLTGDNILRFEGGPGDDTFNVNGDVFVGSSLPLIEMVGGTGAADTLTITDPASTSLYAFGIGGNEVDLSESGVATGHYLYFTVEAINLSSTSATQGATYDVDGLDFATHLTINAGAGDDHLGVGDDFMQTTDFGADANITFTAGAGADSVLISDLLTTGARSHIWSGSSYDHPVLGSLTYSSVSVFTVNSGSGNDTFTATNVGGTGRLVLNGFAGSDLFTISPSSSCEFDLDGGAPGIAPGDVLTLQPNGSSGGVFTPNGTGAGNYQFQLRQRIDFTGMENFTTPPALPAPSAVNLATADDSGISNTDNITNQTSLTFTGTGAPANSQVTIFRDGAARANTTATAGGSFTFTDVAFSAGDDTYVMTAAYNDTASGFLSSFSTALNVRVDTLAPATPPGPDLAAASDSGFSNVDNITNDNTPAFIGAVTANEIVRLFEGATQLGSDTTTSGGTYNITTGALVDGAHNITARVEDLAGNQSANGPALAVTIDTFAPTTAPSTPDLAAGSDSGLSATDNITNDSTPAFSISGPERIRLLANGLIVADFAVPGSVVSSGLGDGVHSMTARSIDLAGNVGATTSAALSVTIDTVAPTTAPTTPDLLAANDSGISNTDNLTNDNTPTFAVTAPERYRLFAGATAVADFVPSGNGTSAQLADGVHSMTARSIDVAGNLSAASSGALNVTIDMVAPAPPPIAPDLTAASDSGISNVDNITNDTTPTFTGTVLSNHIVHLFDDDTPVGSFVLGALSTYTITSSALADGAHPMNVKLEDLAGNLSNAGVNLNVSVDTIAPAPPTLPPDLTAASDTGVSNSDDVTRDNTPSLTGGAPPTTVVRLYANGVEVGFDQLQPLDLTYNITTVALTDGNKAMTTRNEDLAGNLSSAGPATGLRIDTVAPSLVGTPQFNFNTAPHNLAYRFSENVGPTLGAADFTVTRLPGGAISTFVGYNTASNTGTVTFPGQGNGALPDGDYSSVLAAAGVTDIAGNVLAFGNTFNFLFYKGDTDNNGVINFDDYARIDNGFNNGLTGFANGDFNYDGVINFDDYAIIDLAFNTQ